MIKNFLYTVAIGLLFISLYFIYQWYISDPSNKEPLPSLIGMISTIIMSIIAWRFDGTSKDDVKVSSIEGESHVDIEPKKDTNIKVKNVKGKSTVLIGKGKDSLK